MMATSVLTPAMFTHSPVIEAFLNSADLSLTGLEAAAKIIYKIITPTNQYQWPLLSQRLGRPVWVKHENHLPIGAFKLRGGLFYMHQLSQQCPDIQHVWTATRGNHGQSVAFSAKQYGLNAHIGVPEENSAFKNASMRSYGAEVLPMGHDIQASMECIQDLVQQQQPAEAHHFIPTFNRVLVQGVASHALEFLQAVPQLDYLYISIGQGSAICGAIAVRDALGLKTKIIGVVSNEADAYKQSFEAKRIIATATAHTLADGIACRTPNPDAFAMICQGLERVISVSDTAILQAMGVAFADMRQVAEGAGVAALAGLISENAQLPAGATAGFVLSGGNVEPDVFQQALACPLPLLS